MNQNVFKELASLIPVPLDAGQIFTGNPTGKVVKGYKGKCSYTPSVDPTYIFHESARDVAVWFMHDLDPLYLYGPIGCGKTTLIKQLAARLNYPVFEVTGHGRMEFVDLCGHISLQQGNMVYEYGPLPLAIRYSGILLINEIDLLSPDVATGLNGVLEKGVLCLPENGGELVEPNPLFRFACTANTNGGDDDTGLYQGTVRQNIVWLDRFMLYEVGYPTPGTEKELLSRQFPNLPEHIASNMVAFANEVRKLFMGEADSYENTIEVTFSTRTLIRWADLTLKFQPLAHQGIEPLPYAFDCGSTRAMLHEPV